VLSKASSGGVHSRMLALAQQAELSGMSRGEIAILLGQAAHETGGFAKMEENFNYTPGGLFNGSSGKRFRSLDDAKAVVAGGPAAIAERLYGGRADLGNDAAGDGFKFRARGYIGLTGKANYIAAGKYLGIDLVANPDLASVPSIAAKIAVWFWRKRVASKGVGLDPVASSVAINGGTNGLRDRLSRISGFQKTLNFKGGVSVPSGVPLKMPALAEAGSSRTALTKQAPQKVAVVIRDEPGQNVPDRHIAHVASGGAGMVN
jgi:predicted chitinase